MSSHVQQDQVLMNCLHTSQQKEMTSPRDTVFMDFNAWSAYPSTESTYAVSLFQPAAPAAYENSPVMATPLLDSNCFSPTSPSYSNPPLCCNIPQTINIPVEHYLGVEQYNGGGCGPTFTGDPMELLICKSKGASASPTYSSPSDGIPTPLFDPIESAHNDDGSLNEQYELHQQELGALQENYKFETKSDWMDWRCYPDGDISLFQELEGVINTNGNNNNSSSISSSSTPLSSNTKSFQRSPLLSSPATSYFPLLDRSARTATNTTTTTKKAGTASRSTGTKNNKRKRSDTEGQATKKSTTTTTNNDENQQKDGNDDGDDKDNKKRLADKIRKTNKDEKRFGCPICRRKFSRRYNLNTHIRTHNANRIKEFVCDVCNLGFDRKHDRNRHILSVHHGILDYNCEHCTASFCRRDALARHTRSTHPQYA